MRYCWTQTVAFLWECQCSGHSGQEGDQFQTMKAKWGSETCELQDPQTTPSVDTTAVFTLSSLMHSETWIDLESRPRCNVRVSSQRSCAQHTYSWSSRELAMSSTLAASLPMIWRCLIHTFKAVGLQHLQGYMQRPLEWIYPHYGQITLNQPMGQYRAELRLYVQPTTRRWEELWQLVACFFNSSTGFLCFFFPIDPVAFINFNLQF